MTFKELRKTGRKIAESDILVENFCKIKQNSCHGKAEMRILLSRISREVILLFVLVLGILLKSVHACDVDRCWEESQSAYEILNKKSSSNGLKEREIRCISLRTHLQCLVELHGCTGNIKFHGVTKGVMNQMNHYRCSSSGEVYTGSPVTILPPDEECTYRKTKVYRHCGLFGDPHIRTFDNQFQTCRVEGAWPLVDNEHLTVQVTNEVVSQASKATATTKLTVLIKKNRVCTPDGYILYQAESLALPSTFDDGQTHYGKSHTVSLVEIDPGKHVEITLKYIDTKIVIRRVGDYLTFSIQMPEEILKQNSTTKNNLELCVRGCPTHEIIDFGRFLAHPERGNSEIDVTMSRKDAEELCRSANLVDFYFDSCVFDLLTTGNVTFRIAALTALQDVLKLEPDFHKNGENRTTLRIYDNMYGSVESFRTKSYLNLVTVLLMSLVSIILANTRR